MAIEGTVISEGIVGTVKWFNNAKGFGFLVSPEASDSDIFVHYSSILGEGFKTLKENQKVTYTLKKTERGLQADAVQKA